MNKSKILVFLFVMLAGCFVFAKHSYAANYTMTASSYHFNTSSNAITFTATSPSSNFDDTDRIDLLITNTQFATSGSSVAFRKNWPNNPNCTFDSTTQYHCTNNVLSSVNSPSSPVYICMYGEFDNNTYCSQAISYNDLTASHYTMSVSSYYLNTSNNAITFTATSPSSNFDDTDRIDLVVTNTPYVSYGGDVSYHKEWPNNPNCTFDSVTQYHCTSNVLSASNSPASTVYICMFGEFDNSSYCSQAISSSDLTASHYTMTASSYHLNTTTNELTFTATSPSSNFDDTDRIDLAITNTPYVIYGTDAAYRKSWPNNSNCTFDSVTQYHCTNNVVSSVNSPSSSVYICMHGQFDNNTYCSQAILYSDLTGVPLVTYYTKNDGTNFTRSTSTFSSGVATQTKNTDGSVTVSINSATGYADSGFVLYEGTLADLPNFTASGTGDQYSLNLWLDTGSNNEFFAWASNVLTGLDSDTYALGPASSSGTDAITGSSQFFLMSDGQNHSLSDLRSGAVSGISSSTKVAVWVGVTTNSGSTSATIQSVSGL